MPIMRNQLSRRTMIRATGATLGLPFLEAMLPSYTYGMGKDQSPMHRYIMCYIPNGMLRDHWFKDEISDDQSPEEKKEGYHKLDKVLPKTFSGFDEYMNQMLVYRNLGHADHVVKRWNLNGAAHAVAASSFLTGISLDPSRRGEFHAGPSIDQLIAGKLREHTRVPSLELGCDPTHLTQSCVRFSPIYPQTISWASKNQPNPKEISPKNLFNSLFSISKDEAQLKGSMLDGAMQPTKDLIRKEGLSRRDQLKLEEYLAAIRSIEVSIGKLNGSRKIFEEKSEHFSQEFEKDYPLHLDLMFELMALVLKTDTTRVMTFQLGQEISTRRYPFMDIPENHHNLSHNRSPKGLDYNKSSIGKINAFHAQKFKKFLDLIKEEKESDGTVLDNSYVLYGGGMSEGSGHDLNDLPLVLFGGKNIRSENRYGHTYFGRDNECAVNMHISMGQDFGVDISEHGGVTGPLQSI